MLFLYALRDSLCEPGDHPVNDKEIDDIVTYVSSKITPYHCTDTGNADRFYDQHKDDLLYCFKRKVWIVWDGKRWVIDYFDEVREKARATLRSIHHEAALLEDEKTRKLIQKHAFGSESASKEDAMLKKSQTLFRLKDIEFDQQPDLINARNGTIHLPSGELLPHDREHYLTRMVDIDYKPGATCPKWEAFLERVTQGDQDFARQLQKYMGYTLTGNPDEQVMFFLYGTGANGKSTFIETLQRIIEEFAVRINIDHLLESRNPNTSPRQEILEMRGARMVVTSEVPSNHRLNESLIKDLTGGDTISARGIYQKKYERFKPTHKIWMVGNHKPKIYGEDEGILRRINLIPFECVIPEEERRRMSEVLAEFKAEEQGILAWMVEGARLYYEEGLGQVEAVKQATRLYREDLDVVGSFLDDCCQSGEYYTVSKTLLYKAWRAWCEANGEFESLQRSRKWLTYQLLDKGYTLSGGGKALLKGLKLNSSRQAGNQDMTHG
jgi:putative DNA primase/helicase